MFYHKLLNLYKNCTKIEMNLLKFNVKVENSSTHLWIISENIMPHVFTKKNLPKCALGFFLEDAREVLDKSSINVFRQMLKRTEEIKLKRFLYHLISLHIIVVKKMQFQHIIFRGTKD